MKRTLVWLSLGALAVAGTTLAQESKVIKIVSSLPRTGSANAQSSSIVNGIKMAIDEAGGKIGDFTLAYEDWDDASPERGQWDPALEAANAQKAIQDPDIMAYIGTYNSGAAKISMPILNKVSLAMVSPANTYPRASPNPASAKPTNRKSIVPPARSIISASFPPTTFRAKSPRNGPRNSASRRCSSSTTANFTAKASPMSSSARAAKSASRSSATKASTRKRPITGRS